MKQNEQEELIDWKLRHTKKMFREDKIMANKQMPLADRLLLIKIERLYPELLTGKTVHIQVWFLANETGVSRSAVSRFLASMYNQGYFAYNSTLKTQLNEGKLEYSRECFVKELEGCKRPEDIKTRETPKRRSNRKKAMERIKCIHCKSENIMFKVTAVCRDCGKEQP